MLKKSKKLIILMVVTMMFMSTIAHGEGVNIQECNYNSPYNVTRGYSINYNYLGNSNSLVRKSNTYNWQVITLPVNTQKPGTVITPVKPTEPAKPVTPEKPVTPPVVEKPVTPVTPPVVEKPVTPPVVEKPTTPVTTPTENVSGLSAMEMEVVRLVNIERQKAGLQPLKASTELSKVARLKSEDMAKNNYFSHTSPTYGSPFDMMKKFGISYRTAGENIAKGYSSAQSVVNGWMNSSGHRANILNASFGTIGVGAYTSGGTTYWTQMFTN